MKLIPIFILIIHKCLPTLNFNFQLMFDNHNSFTVSYVRTIVKIASNRFLKYEIRVLFHSLHASHIIIIIVPNNTRLQYQRIHH